MKKYFGTAVKFALSLGLGLLIVWLTFSRLNAEERNVMRNAFARANYWWLLVGGAINLLSNYFRTQRWLMLLKALGYTPKFVNTFFSVLVMYFANLLFPRLGEVLRCAILAKYEKIPVNKSIGTMVTERFVDILALPVMMGLLLLVEKDRFYRLLNATRQITGQFSNAPVYNYLFWGIVVLIMLVILYKILSDRTWIRRMLDFTKGIVSGLKSILKTEKPLLFVFHSVAIWFCYCAAAYISFFALPETAGISPWAGLGAVFFGAFAYAAVQGGVGAYPLVLQMLLTVYGIDAIFGLSAGWLIWTVQTGLVIIAGIFSLSVLSVINKS